MTHDRCAMAPISGLNLSFAVATSIELPRIKSVAITGSIVPRRDSAVGVPTRAQNHDLPHGVVVTEGRSEEADDLAREHVHARHPPLPEEQQEVLLGASGL
jgi:hypothetical protein